jgi:tRNA threonylcarbamoyladenosine biosynthesis protein TsaE
LVHIDFYRIENPSDISVLNFPEILSNPENLILLEWPEKISDDLPEEKILITFKVLEEGREINISKNV